MHKNVGSSKSVSIQSVSYGHTVKHHVCALVPAAGGLLTGLLMSCSGGSKIQPESAPVCKAMIIPSHPQFLPPRSGAGVIHLAFIGFIIPCLAPLG